MDRWTDDDEQEYQELLKMREDIAGRLEATGRGGKVLAGALRKGTEVLDIAADLAGTARELPATAGSIAGAETLGRVGQRVGRILPGPLKYAAPLVTLGLKTAGAGLGAVPLEMISESILDQEGINYERLASTAIDQATGEMVSPILGGPRGVIRRVQRVPLDPEAAIIARTNSDAFRKAYGMMDAERARELGLDPGLTERVISLGGLTAAQSRDSRILDLLHGAASGTIVGGREVPRFQEHADMLTREVASNIAEDVGEKMDLADLGAAIRGSARGEFKARQATATPYLERLNAAAKDTRVNVSTVKWEKLPPHMRRFDDVDSISIQSYLQLRREMQVLRDNPRSTPQLSLQAQEGIKQLDRRAMKSLDAEGREAIHQVQRIEKGLADDYIATGLITGLLKSNKGARRFVESLVNKPDYLDLQAVMKVIPDPDVRSSLRRELVHQVIGDAFLPTGRMRGDVFRRNLENKVGRKVFKEIINEPGNDTLQRVDDFIKYRERLQGVEKRGEPGRVAVGLTQMTTAASTAYGILTGRFGRGLAFGLALLGGPGYAGKLLTDPRTSRQYNKLMKSVSSERTPRGKVVQLWRNVAPHVFDKAIVERVAARALVDASGVMDPVVEHYFGQKAQEDLADERSHEQSVIEQPVEEQPSAAGGAFLR